MIIRSAKPIKVLKQTLQKWLLSSVFTDLVIHFNWSTTFHRPICTRTHRQSRWWLPWYDFDSNDIKLTRSHLFWLELIWIFCLVFRFHGVFYWSMKCTLTSKEISNLSVIQTDIIQLCTMGTSHFVAETTTEQIVIAFLFLSPYLIHIHSDHWS